MLTKIGIGSLLAGLFMGVFSGISSFMEKKSFWVDLTLSKVFGENTAESFITFFSNETIQDILDSLMYEIPVFGLLLAIGVLCLFVGLFVKNY